MANYENSNGRRWWLQLQFAFFSDKRVRALRRKFGDASLIIYQKMMLKSLENDSCMRYEGLEDTFEEEIAVDIIEDEAEKIVLIKQVMDFLIDHELMIEQDNHSYFFPQAAKMSGSEGSSAERMRNKRERDKAKDQSYSEENSPHNYTESASDDMLSHSDDIRTITDTNTDLHLKSHNSKTLNVKSKTKTEYTGEELDSDFVDRQTASASASAEPSSGELFSAKQLLAISKKSKVNLTDEGIVAFYDEMQESKWIMYQNPVEKKGIVRALRAYAKYHPQYSKELGDDSKQKGDKPVPAQKRTIEDEIWDIASTYITKRRFDENPGGHRTQVGKYCPKEEFTETQLEYMADKWGIWPKSEMDVLKDEYWETEE